jgi:DNA polymerase III epsilon subunit-like protein
MPSSHAESDPRPAAHPSRSWRTLLLAVAPLLFLDIETTGLRPDRGARITEIGVVDHAAVCLHWTGAPDTTGYDDRLATILPDVFACLASGVVVGHNLSFDVGFLAREADRLGHAGPRLRCIDTLALARRHLHRTPDVRLDTLRSYLGLNVDGDPHTALGDARATRALLWALADCAALQTLRDARMQRLDWAAF